MMHHRCISCNTYHHWVEKLVVNKTHKDCLAINDFLSTSWKQFKKYKDFVYVYTTNFIEGIRITREDIVQINMANAKICYLPWKVAHLFGRKLDTYVVQSGFA